MPFLDSEALVSDPSGLAFLKSVTEADQTPRPTRESAFGAMRKGRESAKATAPRTRPVAVRIAALASG